MLLDRDDVLRQVGLTSHLVGAFGYRVTTSTGTALASFDFLRSRSSFIICLLSHLSFFEHSRRLCLLNHGNFEAIIDENLQVFVKYLFREANVQLFCPTHPVKVE